MRKYLLVMMFFLLPLCANEAWSAMQKVGQALGYSNYLESSEIHFDFRPRLLGIPFKESYQYYKSSNAVVFKGKTVAESNPRFVNASYWLYFHFKVLEDPSQIELTYEASATEPLSGASMASIRVDYVSDAGKTPGDSYLLYIDDQYFIRSWSYINGGEGKPTFTMAWEDYREFSGVWLSLSRKGNGLFQVRFENVEVKP